MFSSRMPGFFRLDLEQRLFALSEKKVLSESDCAFLSKASSLTLKQADLMLENVIGVFGLPLGVATNFVVDQESVLVPMAIEEPSVVAAASHIAKLVSKTGGFKTTVDDSIMIGQIQLLDLDDIDKAVALIQEKKSELVCLANTFCQGLVSRGGGCLGVQTQVLLPSEDLEAKSNPMLVVHLQIDCLDAMGANIVNTVVEGVAPYLEDKLRCRVGFRILSNLSVKRLAKAECRVPFSLLATDSSKDNGEQIARKVWEGWRFAELDPFRAATHNKGIMNGVGAVAVATGNDWRALEAGAHAFASLGGCYRSLSSFLLDVDKKELVCSLRMPMAVGVVGGNTRCHPGVQLSLKILGPFGKKAKKLAGLMASVGLAQNIGALRALAGEGIQQGHMALHARKESGQ